MTVAWLISSFPVYHIRCKGRRKGRDAIICTLQAMKAAPAKRGPAVIRVRHRRLEQALDCDIAVCGGTLGLLVALALQVTMRDCK